MIRYKTVSITEELEQILELQQKNLPTSVSKKEQQTEGFVTVEHTFDLLLKMNENSSHSIVKDKNKVIGYALSMHPKFGEEIEVLRPMFNQIKETLLKNYIVMGQICVDKEYRGQGIFRGLYQFMKKQKIPDFSSIVTEVDTSNTRSLHAHYAVGFNHLKTYKTDLQIWEILFLT